MESKPFDKIKQRLQRNIEDILFQSSNVKTIIRSNINAKSIIERIDQALDLVLYTQSIILDLDDLQKITNCDLAYENFKIAIHTFIPNGSNKIHLNDLLDSAEKLIKTIEASSDNINKNIESIKEQKEKEKTKIISNIEVENTLKLIEEKIQNLEIKTDEQNFEAYIKEALQKLNQANLQFEESNKILKMTLEGNGLVNNKVKELIDASEGHTAYHLAIEFQKKSDNHKIIVEDEKSIFIRALSFVIILSIGLFTLYFLNENVHTIDFWKFLSIKFTITAPFIFYVFFCLNEYTKAKRLYEEFDYKRIMAQTLMNNYNRLKGDFTQDQDKLLDLLKTPIEKIFDNPVHSVFGDKSGDKGLGIDQLEKLVSIAEKLKGKKD